LRQRGAMVASGILTGYAGVFAEHIHNRWPRISASCDDRFCEAPGPHSGKSRMSTPTGNRSTEPPTIPGKIRG
jgi:hypothetical protein